MGDTPSCDHSFILKLTAPHEGGTAASRPRDFLSLPGKESDARSCLRRSETFPETPPPVSRLQLAMHSLATQPCRVTGLASSHVPRPHRKETGPDMVHCGQPTRSQHPHQESRGESVGENPGVSAPSLSKLRAPSSTKTKRSLFPGNDSRTPGSAAMSRSHYQQKAISSRFALPRKHMSLRNMTVSLN